MVMEKIIKNHDVHIKNRKRAIINHDIIMTKRRIKRRLNEKLGKNPRIFRAKSQLFELFETKCLKWAGYFLENHQKSQLLYLSDSDSGPDFAKVRDSNLISSNCWLFARGKIRKIWLFSWIFAPPHTPK